MHLNWVLCCQWSSQKLVWAGTGEVYKNVIIKSAFQVLTKLLNSFVFPVEVHSCRHLSSSSKQYRYMCPAHPDWAEIWPCAATILLCHKQLLAPSIFLCDSPKIPPFDLVTVFRETKLSSQMYFWNHIYFMCFQLPLPAHSSLAHGSNLTISLWTLSILSRWIHDFCHFTTWSFHDQECCS